MDGNGGRLGAAVVYDAKVTTTSGLGVWHRCVKPLVEVRKIDRHLHCQESLQQQTHLRERGVSPTVTVHYRIPQRRWWAVLVQMIALAIHFAG